MRRAFQLELTWWGWEMSGWARIDMVEVVRDEQLSSEGHDGGGK